MIGEINIQRPMLNAQLSTLKRIWAGVLRFTEAQLQPVWWNPWAEKLPWMPLNGGTPWLQGANGWTGPRSPSAATEDQGTLETCVSAKRTPQLTHDFAGT
jgi:hypothetical protein